MEVKKFSCHPQQNTTEQNTTEVLKVLAGSSSHWKFPVIWKAWEAHLSADLETFNFCKDLNPFASAVQPCNF